MAKALNTEEFKQIIQKKNPSIEVIGTYVNARTPIICRCLICGNEWAPFPDNLRRRGNCPKCSGHYKRKHEDFAEELKIINPNIEIIGVFTKTSDHVKVKCLRCDHIWEPIGESLLQGYGCPSCRNIDNSKRFLMDESLFLDKVTLQNPQIIVLEHYTGTKNNIKCKCGVCKHVWSPKAGSLLQGYGCPICAGNHKKKHTKFVEEMKIINPEIEIIGYYSAAKERIKCKCKVCGHIWNPKANNIQQGQGCPQCGKNKRREKLTLSQNEFLSRINKVNPNIDIIGQYKSAHSRVHAKCKICTHEWKPLAWDIIRGTGCPLCAHTSTSFTEQFLLNAFKTVLGNNKVLSRNRSIIGKELDIVIPDLKKAIEPGAWFWHKDKLQNDSEKRKKCEEIGFTLITIYDSCRGDQVIPTDNVFTYDYDLSLEEDNKSLKELFVFLCNEWGIDNEVDKIDWEEISSIAYVKSRKMSTAEFVKKVEMVNHKVIITGEYQGYSRKISCVCKFCGREMRSSPSHLLEGKGCKKCAGVELKTHEDFIGELQIKQPTIIVLGKYINSYINILVRCSQCGNEWNAKPSNLLSGYGCKECSIRNRADKARLTHEQFLAAMKEKGDSNVLIIGQYYNAKTEISCRCRKCCNTWNATPNSLLQGHGCKECNGGGPKKVLCVTTGEIFGSISEAKRKYSIKGNGITQCCTGNQRTCNGKEWKYYHKEVSNED